MFFYQLESTHLCINTCFSKEKDIIFILIRTLQNSLCASAGNNPLENILGKGESAHNVGDFL